MVISPGPSRVARALSYMQMNVVHPPISSLYLSPILICARARGKTERKCVAFLPALIRANSLILLNFSVPVPKTDR